MYNCAAADTVRHQDWVASGLLVEGDGSTEEFGVSTFCQRYFQGSLVVVTIVEAFSMAVACVEYADVPWWSWVTVKGIEVRFVPGV